MIAPELLESLNAAMRELLDNPERDSAWLMLELARLLPGNGPIVTRYGGGSWAASRRWIGRPRDVGVSVSAAGWTWLISAGVSESSQPATASANARLAMIIRGSL